MDGPRRSAPGQFEHLDAERRQYRWGRRIRRRGTVRRRVHRVEVGTHRGQGVLVLMAPSLQQRRMADADAEDEPSRPGLGQRPAAVHHGRRIPHPDVGDAGRHRDVTGRLEDDGAGGKGFASDRFADPDRAKPHHLDLGDGAPQVRRR